MYRRFVVLAGLLFTFGCEMEQSSFEQGDVEAQTSALLVGTNKYWSASSSTVPVCFKTAGWNNWTPAIKDGVRDALTSTWGTYTKLNFTGFGLCPSNPSYTITFDQMSTGGGLTQFPGNHVAAITLNIPTSQATPNENDWNTFVHETGHALGFGHEQERSDNFDAAGNPLYCNRAERGPFTAQEQTNRSSVFDPYSMMNYCTFDLTDWSTNGSLKTNTNSLSYADIRTSQVEFGESDAGGWIDVHAAVFATLH